MLCLYLIFVFRCVLASLYEGLYVGRSVCRSVGPSVTSRVCKDDLTVRREIAEEENGREENGREEDGGRENRREENRRVGENLIGQAVSQNRVYFNGEVMSRNPESGAKSGADAAHWE